MSTSHKDAAVTYSQSYNTGNWEALEALLHPDFVYHSGRRGDLNKAELLDFLKKTKEAFPDAKFFIDDMVLQDDTLGIRHTFEGTMTGSIFGIEPSGKQAIQDVNEMIHFKDGLYFESWVILNSFYLVQQLGIKPTAP